MTGRYATPLQLRMSEAEREVLVTAARARGVPVSVLVREAIEAVPEVKAARANPGEAGRRAAARAEALALLAEHRSATRRAAKARRAAVRNETQEVER